MNFKRYLGKIQNKIKEGKSKREPEVIEEVKPEVIEEVKPEVIEEVKQRLLKK